ncbi:MAG: hypothetical protein ACYTBJ_13575 [Planctomycetota bacterium]|jgi:hypothetical protein
MSRSLIEARAWANVREEICMECEFFACERPKIERYGWDNCAKSIKGAAIEGISRWDADICHYFEPKKRS